MENIVEMKGVNKRYKDFALQDVSFSIKKGYITGFIGPNGAGKSTTIKLLMNLIKRDSGDIFVFGLDNIAREKEIKERIGFVYDESYFYEELTIREMKRIIAPLYRRWDDLAFQRYIDSFELPTRRKIKHLSKGMKMKFSLAVALSHHADLIIMDEPTSGLDPVFRREILDILADIIQDEEKAVFFSTHITTDLDRIADYITFIDRGRIVFNSPKDEILEQYGIVRGAKELLDADTRKEFIGLRETAVGFEGLTSNVQMAEELFGDEALIETPSLEDIMFYTVRGRRHA
ncbi:MULTISPECIES: ABC transporter ATP-binding protein [Aneurinibacillus]|uniref:ABC transporter ATP-binding protein n=1 Tax=Aneurinibacillus danicus TaxID=267746 RepID=A0A511V652_9BACL|nr:MULTISPECIES: ABC transporter ATP-binding protein [Aneurinibacillus]GEN34400.1 ABC transporter ATP-binding protein [Aneurinibacillus danicus]